MVDGFSCILDFSNFFRGEDPRTPPYKGNTSLKPSKSFFNNNSSQRGEGEELESPPPLKQSTRTLSLGYTEIRKPPPLKQSTRTLSLGYTEIEKGRRALGQDLLFCVICNWAV